MKRHNKDIEINSHFNRDEKFTINNIPKGFKSVTDETLKRLRRSAVERVERITDFKPSTLQITLQNNVDAQFGSAYNVLEGDYGTRRSNLEDVYSDGLADLNKAYKIYQLQVSQHNTAFKRYSAANKVINGEELPESLLISDEEMRKLKVAIEQLNRRKDNE